MNERPNLMYGESYLLTIGRSEYPAVLYTRFSQHAGAEFRNGFVIRESGELFEVYADDSNLDVKGDRILVRDPNSVEKIKSDPKLVRCSNLISIMKSVEAEQEEKQKTLEWERSHSPSEKTVRA